MTPRIVKLDIMDNDVAYDNRLLDTYVLINPDENKLAELKQMIETRFDTDGLTDKEIRAKETFRDNIWFRIDEFIAKNFVVLNIDETYEIAY